MEGFFYTCGSFDSEAELRELLLRRYHSFNILNEMSIVEFAEFVIYAKLREKEERIYMQWCAMLPTLNKYMSFEQFRAMITGENVDMRPAEEIMDEIEELHRRKGGTDGIRDI